MSERDKTDSARSKGRKAFWAGIPLADNPMIAPDSIMAWEAGWKGEEAWEKTNKDTLKRADNGDRHAHKEKWFTLVE